MHKRSKIYMIDISHFSAFVIYDNYPAQYILYGRFVPQSGRRTADIWFETIQTCPPYNQTAYLVVINRAIQLG